MVSDPYIPDRGDIVSLQFNPQSGKEQAGRRPAVVLSPKSYNKRVGLVLCCPITARKKGYPFEVELHKRMKTRGVILADHVKSLDWNARNARFLEKLSKKDLENAIGKILILLSG